MATAEWKPAKLDELGFVGRGKSRHRPAQTRRSFTAGVYPFFQTGDIKAANFHLTEHSQTYSEEGLAQSKLWKPGRRFCITIAANIAESAILGIEGVSQIASSALCATRQGRCPLCQILAWRFSSSRCKACPGHDAGQLEFRQDC